MKETVRITVVSQEATDAVHRETLEWDSIACPTRPNRKSAPNAYREGSGLPVPRPDKPNGAFETCEPCDWKLSCTVLEGGSCGNTLPYFGVGIVDD